MQSVDNNDLDSTPDAVKSTNATAAHLSRQLRDEQYPASS